MLDENLYVFFALLFSTALHCAFCWPSLVSISLRLAVLEKWPFKDPVFCFLFPVLPSQPIRVLRNSIPRLLLPLFVIFSSQGSTNSPSSTENQQVKVNDAPNRATELMEKLCPAFIWYPGQSHPWFSSVVRLISGV